MLRITKYPQLVAEITIKKLKDGRLRVKGTGIEPEESRPYEKLVPVTSKAVSEKRKQFGINEVIHKLEIAFEKNYGPGLADEKDMQKAFDTVKTKVLNDGFRLSPRWKSFSTNKSAISFFERHVLQLLLPFANQNNRQFLDSDRLSIRNTLENRLIRENREKVATEATAAAENRMVEASIIYAHMRDEDERIPELKLTSDASVAKFPKAEQLKSLPREMLMSFYSMLKSSLDDGDIEHAKKVFFAVFVVFGLRPAEAAALKPNNIVYADTYCIAEVAAQERNGKLDAHLKNEYSRRIIIISYWGRCLLKRCEDIIGNDYPHDDNAMNSAVKCSRWTKDLLLQSGMDNTLIDYASSSAEKDDLDTDDEKVPHLDRGKIVCYILRRIFAGIARSIMGLSSFVTDRLLGHVPVGSETKTSNVDMNSPDTQRSIAAMMERYVFDPELSLNPACSPIEMSEQDRINMIAYSEYTLTNTSGKKCTMHLNLEAVECGETISVKFPASSPPHLDHASKPKTWQGIARTVIGDTSIPNKEVN